MERCQVALTSKKKKKHRAVPFLMRHQKTMKIDSNFMVDMEDDASWNDNGQN